MNGRGDEAGCAKPAGQQLVGACPAIQRLRELVRKDQRFPVVVVGESGAGKTLVALNIHSCISGAGLVPAFLDCAILSERDTRMGLFGVEPPELTTSRRGVLELPTMVILKHIDRAPPYLQIKLAESLRRMEVSRMGSLRTRPVRCRLVLTLNESAGSLRRKGTLDQRLSECIAGMSRFSVPPLRERSNDVLLLAQHFRRKFLASCGGSLRGFDRAGRVTDKLARVLRSRSWEENVRELSAFIRSLGNRPASDEQLEIEKVLTMIEHGQGFSLKESMARIEGAVLRRAIEKTGGRRIALARLLGLSEREIGRRVKESDRGRDYRA